MAQIEDSLTHFRELLLTKGVRPPKVDSVLSHHTHEELGKRWVRAAVEHLWDISGMRGDAAVLVSVSTLMQLGLRADVAFHVMHNIWKHCDGDDDYMYHYAPWHWLAMHLEQPVDGPGIFGRELHDLITPGNSQMK